MKRQYALLALIFLLFVPSSVFASEIQVQGTVFDQNNHPIPGSVVVVTNTSGKALLAAKADPSGQYRFSISSGTYSLTVSPPSGVNLGNQTITNEKITSPTTLNFMLTVPTPSMAHKSLQIFSWIPYMIGILVFLLLCVGIYFWKKRKKPQVLPQTSSSD